jgi:hypothetical protein
MQHLTRNTNNERLLSLLNTLIRKHDTTESENAKSLQNNIQSIFSGILSILVTNQLPKNIIKTPHEILNYLISIIVTFFISIVLWLLFWKVISFVFNKRSKSINLDTEEDVIQTYNYDILPKIAEINEALTVAISTSDKECKLLNLVTSLPKWKTIICFLRKHFLYDIGQGKKLLRGYDNQFEGIDFIDKYLNVYAIDSLIITLDNIMNNVIILKDTDFIKSINGYKLLTSDILQIIECYNEFKVEYDTLKDK